MFVKPLVEHSVSEVVVLAFNLALDVLGLLEGIAHSNTLDIAFKSMLLLLIKLGLNLVHVLLLVFSRVLLELKVILHILFLLCFDLSLKLLVIIKLLLLFQ